MCISQYSELSDQALDLSLSSLGLSPEPFLYLQSSRDRRLREYMVAFDLSASVLGDHNTFFWAPPGGGKTALRIYLLQNCWSMLGSPHPFPVYVTPTHPRDLSHGSESSSYRYLLRMITSSLVAGLLFQPLRLLDLPMWQQQFLVGCLDTFLPIDTNYLVMRIQCGEPIETIAESIVPNYWVDVSLPSAKDIELLALCLQKYSSAAPRQIDMVEEIETAFRQLIQMICTSLGFRSVFLLVDAVDNFPPHYESPGILPNWVFSLHGIIKDNPNVWMKAFLPSEVRAELNALISNESADLQRSNESFSIVWTQERLVEMLRLRVQVASGGRISSFDAFTGPEFRQLDELIVASMPPRPREVLFFAQQVLLAYWRRTGPQGGCLEKTDVEIARSNVRRIE